MVPRTNALSIRPQGQAATAPAKAPGHHRDRAKTLNCLQRARCKRPVGLMDKASAPGAGDSRFESWAGQAIAHTSPCCAGAPRETRAQTATKHQRQHSRAQACRDPGSNRGPSDLRSDALPAELSRPQPPAWNSQTVARLRAQARKLQTQQAKAGPPKKARIDSKHLWSSGYDVSPTR